MITEWPRSGKDLELSRRGLILSPGPVSRDSLERLRKTTKTWDNRSPCRDLNPVSPEYEAGVLTTRPRPSVAGRVLITGKNIKIKIRGCSIQLSCFSHYYFSLYFFCMHYLITTKNKMFLL
jgi:hypothetical protein